MGIVQAHIGDILVLDTSMDLDMERQLVVTIMDTVALICILIIIIEVIVIDVDMVSMLMWYHIIIDKTIYCLNKIVPEITQYIRDKKLDKLLDGK